MRAALLAELPQIVLLDIGLPGEDGFALARWLRDWHPRLGIIMVTGATDSVDRIVGLETGADDYVTKPYDARELLARIKSVLRRIQVAEPLKNSRRNLECSVTSRARHALAHRGRATIARG